MLGKKDYEYRGLIAEYWDLLRGDTASWPDRQFYKNVIAQSGQPVLDVGCGTGRLLLDYIEQGIDIDGVDNSPEMLYQCLEKARKIGVEPLLFQQSMQKLDIPRKYRTVIVSSSSFQLVIDLQEAAETMSRFFDHLEPGGTLVMPFMILWSGRSSVTSVTEDWRLVAEKANPADGSVVRHWTSSTFDIPKQLENTQDRYEVLVDGKVVHVESYSRSPATRWYTQEQAVQLYQDAGFTDMRLFSEFTTRPAIRSDTLFTVTGVRPA